MAEQKLLVKREGVFIIQSILKKLFPDWHRL